MKTISAIVIEKIPDAFGWWEKTSLAGGGWYKAEVEITGWRPIQED